MCSLAILPLSARRVSKSTVRRLVCLDLSMVVAVVRFRSESVCWAGEIFEEVRSLTC